MRKRIPWSFSLLIFSVLLAANCTDEDSSASTGTGGSSASGAGGSSVTGTGGSSSGTGGSSTECASLTTNIERVVCAADAFTATLTDTQKETVLYAWTDSVASIRRDFKNAVFSEHPELVGMLRSQKDRLVIDRSRGSWWRGFGSVFLLGTRHIAEGTDDPPLP